MQRSIKRLAPIALVAATALVLGACAPGGSGSDNKTTDTATTAGTDTTAGADTTSDTATETGDTTGTDTTQDTGSQTGGIVTDAAQMGEVTITLVDFWRDAEGDWMQASVDAFQAKYPNIHVNRVVQDWSQIMDTAPLRLVEDDAPDVLTVNNGWQSLGALAKGGLVVNLDPYAEAYGWDEFMPTTIKRQVTFTTDGKTMGAGSLWAAPSARVQNIGIYYNKTLLASLGVEVPTTLAEFEAVCEAAKAAGITPVTYGETDKPIATLFALQDILGDKDAISDFIYGSPDVKVADTGLGEAAARMLEWSDKGWFTENYQGLSSGDANAKFLEGESLFSFFYSGLVPGDQANRDEFGYLQLTQDSGLMVATGAPADNLAIGAKSQHKDAAALLLDFLMSEEAAQITVDFGYMPSLHEANVPQDDALIVQEVEAAQVTEADNGYVPYLDWTTPTMWDTVSTQIQLVLARQATPDEMVAAVQADFDAFLAEQAEG
ncbi:MAG: extracellular solute-binding protein [Bifidobacteriaceae bacterium]|jgi:raffinose/stachyose/melibiose transport system substrate-binding protein|nr:extracellular solute-binding protein [Bifidobacteriaceae bacterium]